MLTLTCDEADVNLTPTDADAPAERPDVDPIDDDERAWWASQDSDGFLVEGESDPTLIECWTEDAFVYRAEHWAQEAQDMDRIEAGILLI